MRMLKKGTMKLNWEESLMMFTSECRHLGVTMPLSPHELIQVTGELGCVASLHSLKLYFDLSPVGLYVLGVGVGNRIHKRDRVIHGGMRSNIG